MCIGLTSHHFVHVILKDKQVSNTSNIHVAITLQKINKLSRHGRIVLWRGHVCLGQLVNIERGDLHPKGKNTNNLIPVYENDDDDDGEATSIDKHVYDFFFFF